MNKLCESCVYEGRDHRVNQFRSCDLFDFESKQERDQYVRREDGCSAYEKRVTSQEITTKPEAL